jgi:hypothetical protein
MHHLPWPQDVVDFGTNASEKTDFPNRNPKKLHYVDVAVCRGAFYAPGQGKQHPCKHEKQHDHQQLFHEISPKRKSSPRLGGRREQGTNT